MTYPRPGYKYVVSMASGATLSTAIGPTPGGTERMAIEIHTMASGTNVYIQGAMSNDGTYRRLYQPPVSSATPVAMGVDSSITNCIASFDKVQAQYIKIEIATAMTATTACFTVVFY